MCVYSISMYEHLVKTYTLPQETNLLKLPYRYSLGVPGRHDPGAASTQCLFRLSARKGFCANLCSSTTGLCLNDKDKLYEVWPP